VTDKLSWCRKHNADPANYMLVIPTPFSVENAKMLQHAKSLIEDPDGLIAIHPSFDKLLTSLRTAVATDYKLDKEQTSFNDILDAFRLSLQFYNRKK
jgi:hypothetical protein